MKVLLLLVLAVLTAPVWGIFAALLGLTTLVLALKPVEWVVKRL
jgi:hypothetical protein